LPSSCSMKPNPFLSLNHFTVPSAIVLTSFQKTFFHGPKPQVATLAKETILQSKANPQIEPGH
jgi:hypothetical protein